MFISALSQYLHRRKSQNVPFLLFWTWPKSLCPLSLSLSLSMCLSPPLSLHRTRQGHRGQMSFCAYFLGSRLCLGLSTLSHSWSSVQVLGMNTLEFSFGQASPSETFIHIHMHDQSVALLRSIEIEDYFVIIIIIIVLLLLF